MSRLTITADIMAENPRGSSTREGGRLKMRRISCWNCYKAYKTDVDAPCPDCGSHNPVVRPKESLGYRILVAFLWVDVAFTVVFVVFLAASCA
jgi:hypothetical protein